MPDETLPMPKGPLRHLLIMLCVQQQTFSMAVDRVQQQVVGGYVQALCGLFESLTHPVLIESMIELA